MIGHRARRRRLDALTDTGHWPRVRFEVNGRVALVPQILVKPRER